MSVRAQRGTAAPARWPGRVWAVIGALSAALASQRHEEEQREAAIAEAHALAEQGRAMSREAARQQDSISAQRMSSRA